MNKFRIKGGSPLYGKINLPVSKNAVLPIIAASILCEGEVTIDGVPNLSDVDCMVDILRHLGAGVLKGLNSLVIDASTISRCDVPIHLASRLRSSIFLLGPLVAKFGRAVISMPGGCQIGDRPIDIHLDGLRALGVNVIETETEIIAEKGEFKGGEFILKFPSVGATENLVMAAVLSSVKTVLKNVAREPEVVDLINFLNACGGNVSVEGSDEIVVDGVSGLTGCEYTPISDRIIAGTLLFALAATGGEIKMVGARKIDLAAVIDVFERMGGKVLAGDGFLMASFTKDRSLPILSLDTAPFPAFPTDLQSPLIAALALADGTSTVSENIFENRLAVVEELKNLGADITVRGANAVIKGVKRFSGASVVASDLRAGAALVIAGLAAEGETIVENIHFIDRGYPSIERMFGELGGDIVRVK